MKSTQTSPSRTRYRQTPALEQKRNSTYRNRIVVAQRIRNKFGTHVPVEGEGFARVVAAIRWCRQHHPIVLERLYKGAKAVAARRKWEPRFLPRSSARRRA
jgi:hypothetical protein